MDHNGSSTHKMSDGKLPHSREDLRSRQGPWTLCASRHYVVVDVLVTKGMNVKEGDPLLVLGIKEPATKPKSTRLTQSDSVDILHSPVSSESLQIKVVSDEDLDYAQANKKQKVNHIGKTKQRTLTAQKSCLVAEVMAVKGMEIKPRDPLYALEFQDLEDLSKDACEQVLLSNRKWLNQLHSGMRETDQLCAMTTN